jgi:hypothetical protein
MSHCARHNFAAKTLTLIIIVVVFLGGKLLYDATALSRHLNSPSARNVHHPACAAAFAYYQKAHLAAGAVSGLGPIKITCCMRQLTLTGGKIKTLSHRNDKLFCTTILTDLLKHIKNVWIFD